MSRPPTTPETALDDAILRIERARHEAALARADARRLAAFPTARALLDAWDRPWAGNVCRRSTHRLATMHRLGFDVLEIGATVGTVDTDE